MAEAMSRLECPLCETRLEAALGPPYPCRRCGIWIAVGRLDGRLRVVKCRRPRIRVDKKTCPRPR